MEKGFTHIKMEIYMKENIKMIMQKEIFYHINGDRNEGEFKAGKPVGVHLKYYANGDINQIKFK